MICRPPAKAGPILGVLSMGCGVWVPGLFRFAQSPGTTETQSPAAAASSHPRVSSSTSGDKLSRTRA
ncbi:MAG: hypothetical protein QOD40_3138 [Alphaproteobacteria bacterium]|jgi:hypothetical protein|nr:hypothetical protein [Alphaproteobacteria bacterium]